MTERPRIIPGLLALLLLAGCDGASIEPKQDGALRIALTERCMKNLPAGPVSTQYNDWDEVVSQCDDNAYYETNSCIGQEAQCWQALGMERPKR